MPLVPDSQTGNAPVDHAAEVALGERFRFGRNWRKFLRTVDESRVREAERSLVEMLEVPTLAGLRMLDAGCGSGLFSLAARRLGADVCSFDFDPEAVEAARELKSRFAAEDQRWQISRGSILDQQFLERLGSFDLVYSWGVVHHTGRQWEALDGLARRVPPGGKLFVALYNDQGAVSTKWRTVKRAYNAAPRAVQPLIAAAIAVPIELGSFTKAALAMAPSRYFSSRWNYRSLRGMSWWHDLVDWVGGYPFEVARPEDVLRFCRERDLILVNLRTVGGKLGCNEFVFRRSAQG